MMEVVYHKVCEIDCLLCRTRFATTIVGGTDMRYTDRILGQETYLFGNDSRRFVERKVYCL